MMLPHVMEYNLEEKPDRFVLIADAMGVNIDGMTSEQAARAAVQAVRDLQKAVGLTQTLKDFGIPEGRDALQPMIDLTMGDGSLPYNLRALEEEDIYHLYLKAR
jgi:alcohol dehydrogenase class IV